MAAHYDAVPGAPRPLPAVPGINANPMTRTASIGFTPQRISRTQRPKTRGVSSARPTSGRGLPRTNAGCKRRKRSRTAKPVSAATLHAQWAKGDF